MKFVRVEGTGDLESALSLKLVELLSEGKKVLWLVPGGSNIASVIKIMTKLSNDSIANLTLALTDERYGQPGHPDSNFTQLKQSGLNVGAATFNDILGGESLEATAAHTDAKVRELFKNADAVVGFFGMGADGHTAGILPESPASTETEKWFVGYDAGQFKRLTLTPPALSQISVAYLGAYGKEKLAALTTLQNGNIPVPQQPAQVLKQIPECFVYNDQIGDVV